MMKNNKFCKISLFFLSMFFLTIFLQSCENKPPVSGKVKTEEDSLFLKKNQTRFYNLYTEISNGISLSIEDFHRSYLSSVPQPIRISKNTEVKMLGTEVYFNALKKKFEETEEKVYTLRFNNLNTSDTVSYQAIKTGFSDLLNSVKSYIILADTVIQFYKTGNYKKQPSQAAILDTGIKGKYKTYSELQAGFSVSLKRVKPVKILKNPEEFDDNDKKSIAVLQNVLENVMEKSENLYDLLKKLIPHFYAVPDTALTEIRQELKSFKINFNIEKDKVFRAPFGSKTLSAKKMFEEYFSETVEEFYEQTFKFIDKLRSRNLGKDELNRDYDAVMVDYNNLINAYNNLINLINNTRINEK